MPLSTEATLPDSSVNGSANSMPNLTEQRALKSALQDEIDQFGNVQKIQQANFLRMMQDNQRVLNTSLAEDRALRQNRMRVRDKLTENITGAQPIAFPDDDDMGEIRIDSPNQIHHHYPAPPTSPPAGGLGSLAKLGIGAALALGSGGLGVGVASLLNRPAIPAAINSATGTGVELNNPNK